MMRFSVVTLVFVMLSMGGLMGCASSANGSPDSALKDAELHQSSNLILAGQVTPDQLRELRAEGVRSVINCRRPSEIEKLSFDEPGLLDELGMAYTHLPLGGSDGYSPEDVDAFAETLRTQTGRVLVHCSSGGRVRTLYTAYLIRHKGLSVDEAMQRVQTLGGGPTSLERLLGERLRYELTGEALPPEDEDES